MLLVCLLTSLFYVIVKSQHSLAPLLQDNDQKMIQCIANIIDKYFTDQTELTYVNIQSDDEELLKVIHSTMKLSLISRQPTYQMFVPNLGYIITSKNIADFTKYFDFLIEEPAWNPYVRFLIIIRSLKACELNLVFDKLLQRHVNNVLVVNGTEDAHLYTYNPFDNFACGKYYDAIINYGLCSETTTNLYPHKLVTGLKKCNYTASVSHRPPYSLDPLKTEENKTLLGTEEYIITLLGEAEGFTVNFNYNYNAELYSTVAPNMTAIGPMEMLQKNECQIMFGGMMLVASRAEAFTYLYGYHDYSDELLFAVKSSSTVPIWKYIYLEFEFEVWIALFVAFIIFSTFVIILLRSQDTGEVVLRLFDNLLLHGRDFRTRFTVKYVLISWVWFAYLMNVFYQSNLFSFTTQPSMDFQIEDEEDLINYDLQPCFGEGIRRYLYSEMMEMNTTNYYRYEGCKTTDEAMDTISLSDEVFTLVPNYVCLYNERKYNDKWGEPLIYYFEKPYTKFLFAYFFYEGFPITKSLQLNALRMRESGLADKSLNDNYYARRLKQKFFKKPYESRFFFPWTVIVSGYSIASVTFLLELYINPSYWNRCKSFAFK